MNDIMDNLAKQSNGDTKEFDKEFYTDDTFNEVFLNSAYDESTFIGKFMHLWKWRFYIRNFKKKKLTLKDIPKLPSSDESEKQYSILEREWIKECDRADKQKKKPTLFWPILRIHGTFLIFLSFFGFIAQFAVLYQAICMRELINETNRLTDLKDHLKLINATNEMYELTNSNISSTKHQIYLSCFIMVLMQWLYTNAINVYNYHTVLIGYRIKISLSSMIYRKTLKLSKSAFANTSIGQIQNILAGDMNRLESIFYLVAYPFIGIILIITTLIVLWPYLSYYILISMFVLAIIIPIQSYLGKAYSYVRNKAAYKTDERMRLMNEFIPAIRVIKMYCWEQEFAQMISTARKNEIDKLRNCLYLFGTNMVFFYTGAKVIVYVTLVFYVLFSENVKFNSELVYVTFATLNKLSFILLLYLPHFFLSIINGLISITRIDKFLLLEEIERTDLDFKEKLLNDKAFIKVQGLYASYAAKNDEMDDFKKRSGKIGKKNRGFVLDEKYISTVDKYNEPHVIKNISFDVKPGEILVIIGSVGSGKSSILLSILGELFIKHGKIDLRGRFSYSSQEAWTFAGTVKENILFSCEYDEKKYNEIIKVCALERDMALFPQGDQTIVGERGVALSGGQRARINLARALYYDADIYLLDDPLSAVDPHVAKHIFKEAIQGYLADKIVILVTHQLQFVKNSTKILLIKNGAKVAYGDYNEINAEFLSFARLTDSNEQKEQTERTRRDSSRFGSSISIQGVSNNPKIFTRQDSIDSVQQTGLYEEQVLVTEEDGGECRIREINVESSITNGRGASTYCKAGMRGIMGPLVILLFIGAQLSYSMTDYFLKLWTAQEQSISEKNQYLTEIINNNETTNEVKNDTFLSSFTRIESIYIYSAIIASLIVFSLSRSLVFFKFCMKASVNIHDNLFKKIVRAPLSFFDKNPNQFQVLNRFSKDLQIVDDVLPYRFYDFIDIGITDLGICIMIFCIEKFLIIPIVILVVVIILVRNFYLDTARSIATLEGMSKSPVVQHLASSINGISTIKAFKSQKRFIRKFEMYQNDYSSALFTLITSRRWLVYVMDSIQVVFIAGIMLVLCIYIPDGPTMGLIVSNILMLTSEMQWLCINWTDFSTFLTSVERLDQYSDVEQEPPLESEPSKTPPYSWPEFGRIEFRNVTMRYFENESPVLKNLNFTIDSKEKIGVVGRTGAGKSSLISALFRMTEYEGDIYIDGINCKEIGLHELRRKISIIPQEPILFTGTVRSNLDPTNLFENSDDELWTAIKEAQLESAIKELDGGLDAKIVDSGANFSIGQKQLICLARAILKRNKILVLDEATANCDPGSDSLIQETIRSVFKQCTIITIAHRLNTIIDSDKILVLDAGEVKEFDTPYNLLRIPSSLFSGLINATGHQNAKQLKILAKNASFRKLSLQNLND